MFSRRFGQRTTEKDEERLLVNLAGNICRVIALAVGWKINTGTTKRFLQHSTGFQLDEGGNARGTAAADLQQSRDADTQVASGDYSFLGAGLRNTASGSKSAVMAGWKSSAGGDTAIVLGGYQNVADEDVSIAMGGAGIVHNSYQMAHGHQLTTPGDAQVSRFPMSTRITHGSPTWYPLDLSGENGIVIPADTVMTFRALVSGITQGCAKTFNYEIVGSIKNDGGTTTLTASTVTVINEDDASFDCRAQANDTDDTLEIQVQDADGSFDDVKWCARVVTAEVSFAA